jgi:hypothetical protein
LQAEQNALVVSPQTDTVLLVPKIRERPLLRRVSTGMTGPMMTFLLTVTVLYVTLVPLVVAFGPDTAVIASAVIEFGAQLEVGAVSFQGITLGLLSALFIARVIAPVPDVRNQSSVSVGAAVAGHVLAGTVIGTAAFTFIGTIHNAESAGRVWFVIVLAVVAFGLAQAINADITFGRKRQRRRTKNELIVTCWGVHRRAAALHEHAGMRRAPYRRLLVLTSMTIVASASLGTAVIVVAYSGAVSDSWAVIVGSAVLIAAWGTFWVGFLISTTGVLPTPRWLTAFAWIMTGLTTVAPAAVVATAPTGAETWPFKAAVVLTVLMPFGLLLGSTSRSYSMRTMLLAVELRRYRRRRLLLVRDYYALKKRRRTRQDQQKTWDEKALRRFLRGPRTPRPAGTPKPVSLAQHRPDTGIGSYEWWVAAGEPDMWRAGTGPAS